MHPLLRRGDLFLFEELENCADFRVGDMAVIRLRGGGLVVHRVIGIEGNRRVVTKGDNSPLVDEWTVENALVGRVVAATRGGKRWRRPRAWVGRGVALTAGMRFQRPKRLVHRVLELWAWGRPGPLEKKRGSASMAELGRERFEMQQLGDSWIVHDTETGDIHELNYTAGLIYSGVRSGLDTAGLLDQLSSRFPGQSFDLLRLDIESTLSELRSLQLVD